MWPFRRRPPTAKDEADDAELQRSREAREQVDRFIAQAQRTANRLEVALNKNDGRRMGRA